MYTTRDIWIEDDGGRIYGMAYIPDGVEKAPLVVFSHELGADHARGIPYGEALASKGFALYTFDFRGGSARENRSDGASTAMSVMTEVVDLGAVIDAAKTWDFVEPERIALLGASQGGLVSAIYASEHPGNIAGLALLYPAFSIRDTIFAQFSSIDELPDTYGLFGGWITVGSNYASDMWDYDAYEHVGAYRGKVLIVHGDSDRLVDLSYSQRAAAVYPSSDLRVIEGGGHGFGGQSLDVACGLLVDYFADVLGTG